MKTAFSVLALSGALLLTGISSGPASAQAKPVNDPHAIQYSWGVIVSPPDGRERSYTWQELGRSGAPSAAQSRSVGQKHDASTRAAIVNDTHAIQYSWGVIISPPEGRSRSYTWEELGRTGVASAAQSPSVGQKLDGSTRAAVVNDPHAIQYSWGVIVSPPEGRDRSYTWQELDRPAAPSVAQSHSAGQKLDASARASGPQVRDRN